MNLPTIKFSYQSPDMYIKAGVFIHINGKKYVMIKLGKHWPEL